MRKLSIGFLFAALVTGCGPLALEDAAASDAGRRPFDASGVLSEFDPVDAGTLAPRAPNVRVTVPSAGSALTQPVLRIEGGADDDTGVASVRVRVGPNQPLYASSPDNFRSWTLEAQAPVGSFELIAVARDSDGNDSVPVRVMLSRASTVPDDQAPQVGISEPADGSTPLHPLVLVRGTASDDRAVVSMQLTRNGVPMNEREIETDDFYARWARMVPLLPGEANELVFSATDASGHQSSAKITLQGRASTDRSAPMVDALTPAEGARFASPTLELRGRANDDVGIREIKVRIGHTPPGASELVWGAYQAVRTSDGYANFDATVEVPSGPLQVEVRAIDLSGLASSLTRNLTNDFVSPWSDEVAVPLRVHEDSAPAPLRFALDRQGIDEVFTQEIQRDIRVLELDTTALITDAVTQIKTSCGVRWRENNADPRHDCSATDYGKDRNLTWQETPEYSMVRLLTMTPANVVVSGTSLANLQGLADLLGIGGGFHEILSHTLGIPITQEIVSTGSVVQALQEFWMQTHPNVLPGAKLPITLYDSMHELMPLADRFGPVGAHPGLLDPAFPPRSQLLTPEFEMRLTATSNLRWLDGIDVTGASDGRALKDYLALVVDTTGPTYDDVLEFDFNDPARFDVVGLVQAPRADMRMLLRENSAFVRTCTSNDAVCKNNLPSAPANGYVWANPRFQIESVVAAAAYNQYRARSGYSRTYDLFLIPSATVTVGASGNPAGWTTFQTLVNLGDPPPPQYLWETISEVAQVALHSFSGQTLDEGEVNVAFTLRNVDVGLSADGIRSAMRPRLQEQRQKLSDRLLGDYKKNNGAVDFYYRRGADGAPYLFFVAPSDPLPRAGYTYAAPGFFADEALTNKLSTTNAGSSGDSVHEKLALTAGQSTTVYMKDETGALVRLRIVVPADVSEFEVFVSRKVR